MPGELTPPIAQPLLVAIVTHTAPPTLPTIVAALRAQAVPAEAIVVLFTGAVDSPRQTVARAVADTYQVRMICTPGPARIGEARAHLISMIDNAAVAWLDDDCVPRPAWWTTAQLACRDGGALLFGPRFPAAPYGLGAMVRTLDAAHSAKLRRHGATVPVMHPAMLTAGGNMITQVEFARRLGLTDPAFARGAFEDVDYQLRLIAAGGRVVYWPTLTVDHYDVLSGWQLLRKNALSGAGMARCAHRHGRLFWTRCRWRPWRLVVPWLPAFTALPLALHTPLALLGVLIPVLAAGLRQRRSPAPLPWYARPAAVVLAPTRNLIIAISYLVTRLRVRIRPLATAMASPVASEPDTIRRRTPLLARQRR